MSRTTAPLQFSHYLVPDFILGPEKCPVHNSSWAFGSPAALEVLSLDIRFCAVLLCAGHVLLHHIDTVISVLGDGFAIGLGMRTRLIEAVNEPSSSRRWEICPFGLGWAQ